MRERIYVNVYVRGCMIIYSVRFTVNYGNGFSRESLQVTCGKLESVRTCVILMTERNCLLFLFLSMEFVWSGHSSISGLVIRIAGRLIELSVAQREKVLLRVSTRSKDSRS